MSKIKPEQVAGEDFDTDLLFEGFGFFFNIQYPESEISSLYCTRIFSLCKDCVCYELMQYSAVIVRQGNPNGY